MIDWAKAQRALARLQLYSDKIDAVAGAMTFTALLAFAADRPADATIKALGAAAARAIAGDDIGATAPRLAEFFAQCCNETGGFVRFEEDLRYSAAAMVRQWPSHFTPAQAQAAVGRPIEIASRAYGGRMGNATYPSQDGWLFRGRGMLQLTGRANYLAFGKLIGIDLVADPDLAADPADSLLIAREFWRRGAVNAAIDAGNFLRARQITNGPTAIGLDNVARLRGRILSVFA